MITRIVKLFFKKEHVADFQKLLAERQDRIAGFTGCQSLEVLQGIGDQEHIFLTYSRWESEEALNAYRNSAFFEETWTLTKAMFGDRPQAISTHSIYSSK